MGAKPPRAGAEPVDPVIRWRRDVLVATGFEPGLAAETAASRDMDLDAVIRLVENGCPPPLAVRILAPLEPAR